MKQTEIIKLSNEELAEAVQSSSKKVAELKMAHTLTPLENPLQIRSLRRTVARLNTEIAKRNLA